MKKIFIPALILILLVALFSLASVLKNKPKPLRAPQAIDIAYQQQLAKRAYVSKMSRLITRVRSILKAKFMYHNKEKEFFPKKDSFANAAAIDFYTAQKVLLEGIRQEALSIPAADEYKPAVAKFTGALDAGAAYFDKAIQSLQKNDPKIMKERPVLLKDCDDLLNGTILGLQK